MELKDFVGRHFLFGVDFDQSDDGAQICRFGMDGIVYSAMENPQDGYRSCLDDIGPSNESIKNVFNYVEVVVTLSIDASEEIIEFRSIVTGEIILCIGTTNTDDYYPAFVANFRPENIPKQKVKTGKGRMLRPIT